MSALFNTATNHEATGINDGGEVVGIQIGSNGKPNLGWYWLGSGGGGNWTNDFPSYYPINRITNNSMTGGQQSGAAAYWQVGSSGATNVGKLSDSDPTSQINGLNDNNVMVGESGNKALLFDLSSDTLYNLNTYLPNGSPFTQLTAANDINNSNEFIGEGLVNGVEHGFVGQISSVPEPSALVLLGIGAVSVLAYGWRRRARAS
jgi:hypothetical protein